MRRVCRGLRVAGGRSSPALPLVVLLAVLGLTVALAGCGADGRTGADAPGGGVPATRPVPPSRNALPRGGCPLIGDPAAAQRALQTARPGDRVCLGGPELASATLQVTSSGVPGAPIQVVSDGSVIQGIDVRANQVEVAGFTLRDGGELSLRGGGLTARQNNVVNARKNGISCLCSDSLIEANMVDGADGTGIWVEGERVGIRANTVTGSVRRVAGDADGVRFFGHTIQISDNVVRDISATGYPPDQAPHPDCFQTYDSDAPPTYDVVISGNRCVGVDESCLLGTGKNGNPGVPAGTRSVVFADNYCEVGGVQAINLDGYPHVEIRGNTVTGPNLFRGIHLAGGSTDAVVVDNVLVGDKPVLEADDDSPPARQRDNTARR